MRSESEEAKGTQAESSGGAGRHPLPREETEGREDDPKVAERQDEATTELRERGPSRARESPSDATSGG